jgi:hypothetical protein
MDTEILDVSDEILAQLRSRLAAEPARDIRRIAVLDWLDDSVHYAPVTDTAR